MNNAIITIEQALFFTSTVDILKAGKFCPYCHERLLYYSQVGCCVYAVPCNCRQYCGKIKDEIKESQLFRHS